MNIRVPLIAILYAEMEHRCSAPFSEILWYNLARLSEKVLKKSIGKLKIFPK